MRTITRTYEVFPIMELSEDAIEKAHSKWREWNSYPWEHDNTNTLDAFCSLFNVKCHRWEYDTCTYNYRFSCSLDDEVLALKGIRLLKYLINNYWNSIYAPKTYYKRWDKKRQSRIFREEDCVLTGYCADMDILQPIYRFIRKPEPETTFETLLDSCLDSFFKSCRNDMDNYFSEENFKEESIANDWEYFANGQIFS